MENKNYGPGAYLLSFVFLIWFFGSIAGMFYFSKQDQAPLAVALAGQVFLVFGLIIIGTEIHGKSFQPVTLIFPVAGIIMIAGAMIYYTKNEKLMRLLEKLLPDLILSLFFIIGACVVLIAFVTSRKKREKCSYVIHATCVGVKTRRSDGALLECPVYEIYYRGELLELCNETYSNINKITPGETREIHINPDDPTEFYEEKADHSLEIFLYVFGGMFMVMSLIAFYVMHVYG